MKLDIKKHADFIVESFNVWYHKCIKDVIARLSSDEVKSWNDTEVASAVVHAVSQFALGRLITELKSVNVSTNDVITFLKRHASQ